MSGLGSVLFETRKETGADEKHISNVYDESGKVTEKINDKSYAVIEDTLGSIEEFVNVNDKEDTSNVSYSPWGDVKEIANNNLAVMDLVSYTGYGYNALSNLYLAVNRIYDVTTRSYMQRDKGQPMVIRPSSFETYAYVENNPVNYVDPYGLSIISKVGSWVSDTADAFVSTVKNAAGAVKDAVVDAAEEIKDAVVDAAHELVTDVKKVLNINSKIFKTGINAGIGAAAVVALGLGLPAAIGCAFAAVAVGAVLGVGRKAAMTFANGGTYADFLCGLEDDIYSGAEFMSMMFMMTATTAESVCSAMDKGFAEYNEACQKYYDAKNASNAADVSVETTKPKQLHHYATDKNSIYTQKFEKITKRYNLDLDGDWNKELLPHQGRHPNAYHEFILSEMEEIDNIADGNVDIFIELYEERVKSVIRDNPDMLYKKYWTE